MILATLGTSMVKVVVVTRCHAQYGAVHNHRDLCDTPLGLKFPFTNSGRFREKRRLGDLVIVQLIWIGEVW